VSENAEEEFKQCRETIEKHSTSHADTHTDRQIHTPAFIQTQRQCLVDLC